MVRFVLRLYARLTAGANGTPAECVRTASGSASQYLSFRCYGFSIEKFFTGRWFGLGTQKTDSMLLSTADGCAAVPHIRINKSRCGNKSHLPFHEHQFFTFAACIFRSCSFRYWTMCPRDTLKTAPCWYVCQIVCDENMMMIGNVKCRNEMNT